MLVREDHVAGERSCWWERIMLVGKDHVGGKGSCGCCKMVNYCKSMILASKNILFHRTDSRLSVRNINRSKLYVSSPPTWFYGGVGVRRQANVEIIPKKYAKKIKGCPYILSLNRTWKKSKKSKKSKILGMVRDALGSVGGSSLSIFTGFSKDFEKLNFRKLKIGRNRFKMGQKYV